MADQDQVPQSSIPPKVTPFAKPEGAAPVSPAAPGAPRPITVRLKPVAPAAAQAPEAEAQVSTPLASNPRVTARVPIPEIDSAPASVKIAPAAAPTFPQAVSPATVRLRPVMSQAAAPAVIPAAAPLQPQHPPTPGSHPLPDGPKPPSGAQVQAAKSKTSRISLDSAIGVAPMAPMGADKGDPKTIRLKRPADLSAPAAPKASTTPIRQTSRIPDSALPTAEAAAAESSTVTQKKTLKIKRPGVKEEAAAEAPGDGFPEGVQMVPVSSLDMPAKEESPVFTAFAVFGAVAALFVIAALTWCLAAQAVGPVAGVNATASISGPELPWGGRISE